MQIRFSLNQQNLHIHLTWCITNQNSHTCVSEFVARLQWLFDQEVNNYFFLKLSRNVEKLPTKGSIICAVSSLYLTKNWTFELRKWGNDYHLHRLTEIFCRFASSS